MSLAAARLLTRSSQGTQVAQRARQLSATQLAKRAAAAQRFARKTRETGNEERRGKTRPSTAARLRDSRCKVFMASAAATRPSILSPFFQSMATALLLAKAIHTVASL
jgi:hypothetical protein